MRPLRREAIELRRKRRGESVARWLLSCLEYGSNYRPGQRAEVWVCCPMTYVGQTR